MVQIFSTMVLTCGTKFVPNTSLYPRHHHFAADVAHCKLLEIHNFSDTSMSSVQPPMCTSNRERVLFYWY